MRWETRSSGPERTLWRKHLGLASKLSTWIWLRPNPAQSDCAGFGRSQIQVMSFEASPKCFRQSVRSGPEDLVSQRIPYVLFGRLEGGAGGGTSPGPQDQGDAVY